jgi:arabinose-5-phosphate isomerase
MNKKIRLHPCLKVKEEDKIVDIAKLMKAKKERRVFVVGKGDILKGIITNTDIVAKVVSTNKFNLKAKDVMTKNPSSIDISDPLENALGIMNKHETFVCPVVDHGKLIGLIQYKDVMNSILLSEEKED